MAKSKKFGTFLGVYLPSLLTILGLIMYLRFGWVLGNVGLPMTIMIVLMASSITFITGLSASAIATNIKVGVGGEYFLISRSLGLEAGGAIGIPLYFCRTLSVTFYSFGLAEALLILWPHEWGIPPWYSLQLFAAGIIVFVTLFSGKSASLVLKSQVFIMILVCLSILALIVGVFMNGLQAPEMTPTYRTAPEGFWYVFAVFFPAVTGFTAGIGMSGDLKNPGKSIPKGTLGAVVSGAIIYIIIPLFLAVTAAVTIEEMADPNLGVGTWTKIAFLGGILIYPAVWGAILSSAFGSILGGPRVLQALAMDGLAPKFLSKLSKSGQPTIATWITGVIALAAVSLGELNTVAKFVSVLFLTLYIAINLSATIETLVKEPSYRPKIRVPWYVSILGAIGALLVMYLISPIACILAFIVEIIIFVVLRKRSLEQEWGDVTAGFWAIVARYSLLQLGRIKIQPRNWRPHLLLFVNSIKDRINLVRFASELGHDHGILSIAKLITSISDLNDYEIREMELEMKEDLQKHNIDAFCEVNKVNNIQDGIISISKGHGIAGLKTNTVLFGWSMNPKTQVEQFQTLSAIAKNGQNIILLKMEDDLLSVNRHNKKIDIWWRGKENNGELMLLCAYLLKFNREWEKAEITIKSVVNTKEEKKKLTIGIASILPQTRIKAKIKVIVQHDRNFRTVLCEESAKADLVFLGLGIAEKGNEIKLINVINDICANLRSVAFVKNNSMANSLPLLLQIDKE
jgi:amino acid transporter